MKTTIRDVAEAAGVSAMAVSAVLNGAGRNVKVSHEKAEHIRRVARELRYQPNSLARSLRSRRTGMVGVVFQHLHGFSDAAPYFPNLLNGVMAALFPADYTLALCPKLIVGGDAGSISDGRFDGVLWCRPDFTEASLGDDPELQRARGDDARALPARCPASRRSARTTRARCAPSSAICAAWATSGSRSRSTP